MLLHWNCNYSFIQPLVECIFGKHLNLQFPYWVGIAEEWLQTYRVVNLVVNLGIQPSNIALCPAECCFSASFHLPKNLKIKWVLCWSVKSSKPGHRGCCDFFSYLYNGWHNERLESFPDKVRGILSLLTGIFLRHRFSIWRVKCGWCTFWLICPEDSLTDLVFFWSKKQGSKAATQ